MGDVVPIRQDIFRLPKPTNRTTIVGSTGSGKTCFATWLLLYRDWLIRPWFIIDFKRDELLADLPTTEISLTQKLPKEPGLYILRPLPGQDDLLSAFFYRLWHKENCGLFIDEGTMVPFRDRWFRALLTQGRSKHIEMIVCSQRPVWLDKYVFTESEFFAVFRLNSVDDRKHMRSFLDGREPSLLQRFHSQWYDVVEQRLVSLLPVPTGDALIAEFNARAGRKVGVI